MDYGSEDESLDDSPGLSLDIGTDGLNLSLNLPGGGGGKRLHPIAVIALGAAVVPFFVSFTVNGFNFVKLVGGSLAIVLGCVGVVIGARKRAHKAETISLSLVAILVGATQIVLSGFLGTIITGVLDDAEEQARTTLEARGMQNVVLEKGLDGYSFQAEQNGQYCEGVVEVRRQFVSMETSVMENCGLPMPLDRLQAACARGDGQACAEASLSVQRQTPVDWPRSTLLAKTGCEHGSGDACFYLARAQELGERGVPQDVPAAVASYARACDAGHANACFNRGVLLRFGRGVPKDAAAGCDAWETACSLRAAYCGALGECFRNGDGRALDLQRARDLFHQGCQASDGLSCVNEAASYLTAGETDEARALTLYTRACELHEPVGCRNQASLQIQGPAATRDPLTAVEKLSQMCDAGDGVACVTGGMALDRGVAPLDRDRARAFALFEKACTAGRADGCRNVAVYLRDREGGQRGTRAQIRAMFTRACELGSQQACREAR